ncbi:hypothetical protein WMF45_11535 [Sorangium sp. So ce448]|uniref:hypothetical protein n=1 Tax=Sorangium sp. So ce448 TaxID=3133314 RepID=UPI003F63E59D
MSVVIKEFEVAPAPAAPAPTSQAAPPGKPPPVDPNELRRALAWQARRALRVRAY